jgi:chromosome partitioning protein
MAYTIAIANEKGGVAKTTTTLSLGAALAENGQKVLIVDLDPQANLSMAIGVQVPKLQISIKHVLLENASPTTAIQQTSIENLFILPATHDLSQCEHLMPERSGYVMTLRKILKGLSGYDAILLDCPPFLGAITFNALAAADLLLVPTQAEYFSIAALRNLMNTLRQVRAEFNPRLTYRLLLTMFDRRNRIHRTLSEQLRTSFSSGIMTTVIEIDTKLREAPISGVPINMHAPKSRAALQYRALAQEISEYAKETTAQPA